MLLHRSNLELARLASTDATRIAIGGLYLSPTHTVATDGHVLGAVEIAHDIDATEYPHVAGVSERPTDCGWCMPCWPCAGAALVAYDVACLERLEAIARLEAAPATTGALLLPPPVPEAPALADAPRWHACVKHRPAETKANAAACPVELEWALRPCILERGAALELGKLLPKRTTLPVLGRALVDVPATNLNGTIKTVTTDLDRVRPVEARKVEGEYPDWHQVMPAHPATTHAAAVGVNPKLLGTVLDVAVKSGVGTVTIRTPVDGLGPIMLEGTVTETGARAVYLVMPCRI